MSRSSIFAIALVAGCSSSSSGPVAGQDDAAGDVAPDTLTDASPEAPIDAAACTAMRTPAAAPTCGDACDVRLLLPGGDKYCTTTCAKSADCAALGAGLICSSGTGTCVPACTGDASCTAAGFQRCDTSVGGCDTI